MFIEKKRAINFLFSLFLLSILIVNIPIIQSLKYILFVSILFCLITFESKNNLFTLRAPFFLLVSFFIIISISINFLPLKYHFKISSFDKINFDKTSQEAKLFYTNEFKNCIGDSNKCYHPVVSKYYFLKSKYKIKDSFKRNYLNITNLNELRTNLFHSDKGSIGFENQFINKFNYPFIINFYFPNLYFDSELCYEDLYKKIICQIIQSDKNEFEIFGKGENFKIYLKQNKILIIAKLLLSISFLLIFIYILKFIYIFKIRNKFELTFPISLILILFILTLTNIENINFLNSYFYQYPGGDGHLYLIWANIMSASFKNYDLIEFLRGGSDVFYWMPGMRYFLALEKTLYGNAYYLHLIILSFLPFIIQRILNFYFSKKVVYFLMFSFLFFPLMHHMGFSYFQFFRYFTKVFAEPISYTIFLFGFLRLIYYFQNKEKLYSTLPLTCFILVLSCLFRPNLSSSCFFLLLLPLFDLIFQQKIKITIFYILSGLFIFLPLFHNLYYGNEFILFTSAVFSNANIKIQISDYLNLLFLFEISNDKLLMLIEMLKNFINPFEIHKYFILIVLFFSLNLKNIKNPKLYPLYILIFSQFFLFFFLNPGPRYMWIFWIASLVLSLKIFIDYRNKRL